MNGSLHYTSAVGKGTTASILLPVELLPAHADDPPPSRKVRVLSDELAQLFDGLTNGTPSSSKPLASPSLSEDCQATPTMERSSPGLRHVPLPGVAEEGDVKLPTPPPEERLPEGLRVLVADDNAVGL